MGNVYKSSGIKNKESLRSVLRVIFGVVICLYAVFLIGGGVFTFASFGYACELGDSDTRQEDMSSSGIAVYDIYGYDNYNASYNEYLNKVKNGETNDEFAVHRCFDRREGNVSEYISELRFTAAKKDNSLFGMIKEDYYSASVSIANLVASDSSFLYVCYIIAGIFSILTAVAAFAAIIFKGFHTGFLVCLGVSAFVQIYLMGAMDFSNQTITFSVGQDWPIMVISFMHNMPVAFLINVIIIAVTYLYGKFRYEY